MKTRKLLKQSLGVIEAFRESIYWGASLPDGTVPDELDRIELQELDRLITSIKEKLKKK